MDARVPGSSGLLGSMRGLAEGLLGSLHDRIELAALELHEEKHRLVQTFVWLGAVVFLAVMTVAFASFGLVVLFWDTARGLVVGLLVGAYLLGFVAALVGFRRFLQRQPLPFAATRLELQKDKLCTQNES